MNPDTDLTIGRSIMDEVNIQIINSSKIDDLIWNQVFQLEFGLEVGLVTDWVTIGYYSGKRPDKVHNVDVINFTAYDGMSKFYVLADEWLASLTYPMTLGQMYASMCDFVGVTMDAGDELDNIKNRIFLTAPISNTGLMRRTILSAMAEAFGCIAKMNADGHVQMKWFSDQTSYELGATEEFSVNMVDLKEGKKWIDIEDKTWEDLEIYRWVDLEGYNGAFRINSVTVKLTEEDIGVSFPSHSGFNDYLIIDNPFLRTSGYTDVQLYIAPLYARLNGFGGYLPMSVEVIGNALVEAGDVITVEVDGENYRPPIFTRVLQWSGGLYDRYESTGNLDRQEYTGEQKVLLEQGGRYLKFLNTIDQLYSELYDPTTGDVSIIKQIVNAILLSAAGIDLQAGKYIRINSQSELDVKSGGTLNVESGGKMDVKSGGGIDVESGGDVNIKNGGKFNVESGGDMEIKSGGSLNIVSGGTLDVDTQNFVIDSANKIVKTGEWQLDQDGLYIKELNIHQTAFTIGNPRKDWDLYLAEANINSIGGDIEFRYYDRNDNNKPLYFSWRGDLDAWEINAYRIPIKIGGSASVDSKVNLYGNNVYYTNLIQNSTKDIKHDIKKLPSVGEKLDKLEPVTFVYDDDPDEKVRTGLIYEDAIKVIPEVCTKDESVKAISYVELVPMLLKEIQDLRKRVKALEEREEK